MAGNADQGRVYVFSGLNGGLLLTLDSTNPQAGAWLGESVAMGDVDGDGRADVAAGAPHESGSAGAVYSSLGDGTPLHRLAGAQPGGFGEAVAVGDVDGDGKGDVAVGAPGETVSGVTNHGRAYVFSGASGDLLFTLGNASMPQNTQFGISLAIGDINDDGLGDIAVGGALETVGGIEQGRVRVFSGLNGLLLTNWTRQCPRTSHTSATKSGSATSTVTGGKDIHSALVDYAIDIFSMGAGYYVVPPVTVDVAILTW